MNYNLFPICKDTVLIKKYPHLCLCEELYSDATIQLNPLQAFIFALCNGQMNISSISYIICNLFEWEDSSYQMIVDRVFKDFHYCFHFYDSPRNIKLKHKAEDFLYYPIQKDNIRHFDSPSSMSLVLTHRCNFKCIYCYNNSSIDFEEEELTTEQWIEFIHQASNLGVLKCTLTGGEPMMHPGFLKILEELHKNEILVQICTNGSLINEFIIQKFVEMGQRVIQISLDTPHAKSHDNLTQSKGCFEKIVENIKKLSAANIMVTVKSVILPENLDQVPQLIALCSNIGVDNLILDQYDLCYLGRGNNEFFLSMEQEHKLKEIIDEKNKIDQKMNINLIIGNRNWIKEDDIVSCGALENSFTIMPDGTFPICEKVNRVPELLIGKFPEWSIADMWNSSSIKKIFEPSKNSYKEPCKSCIYLKNCNTGCFATKSYFGNNLYGPDPRCWRATYDKNPFVSMEVNGNRNK